MNTMSWLLIPLLLGYLLEYWLLDRRRRRDVSNAVDKTVELQEGVFMEGTRVLAEQVAELRIEVERARDIAGAADAKTGRYFEQISVFEKQRDRWQTLYFEQAVGHGNAQSLMMGTIEKLSRDLTAKGGRPQVPKVLHTLREEYIQTHELPAKEGLAALNPKQVIAEAGAQALEAAQAIGDSIKAP